MTSIQVLSTTGVFDRDTLGPGGAGFRISCPLCEGQYTELTICEHLNAGHRWRVTRVENKGFDAKDSLSHINYYCVRETDAPQYSAPPPVNPVFKFPSIMQRRQPVKAGRVVLTARRAACLQRDIRGRRAHGWCLVMSRMTSAVNNLTKELEATDAPTG